MPDFGFAWDINEPSPSGPTATAPAPMNVVTHLDPDTLDDFTGWVINWGDGHTTHLSIDWDVEADHTYPRPGTYVATARTVPAGGEEVRTFTVLGLTPRVKEKRVNYLPRRI